MPVKGVVESWMGERRRDRKRESCNLYIKASIERVSSILAKREEDIQTRESIYIYMYLLCPCMEFRETTRTKCLANLG